MAKKLNVKRVVMAVAVATTVVVAPITVVVTNAVSPIIAEYQESKKVKQVDHDINNVVAQVQQYCTSNTVDTGTSTCGFYKSQEIVKWMDKEDALHGYTVAQAQELLDIRDTKEGK